MAPSSSPLTRSMASQLWAVLGTEGKAPTELCSAAVTLPSYSVGIEAWLDRLAVRYLNDLCQEGSHFKLVIAPYGGGKTHFLMALGARGLREGYAVSYVPCGGGVGIDNFMQAYREIIKHIQLPAMDRPGLASMLNRVVELKRRSIQEHQVPDVEAALDYWISHVRRSEYPENAFGRVVAAALKGVVDGDESLVAEAACDWLRGDVNSISKAARDELRLQKPSKADENRLGRDMMMSLVQFVRDAGLMGMVLLFDEAETMFNARGKALERVLSAMRVLLDRTTGVPGGVPLFGIFAAVPDVLDQMRKYPAVEQRMSVFGASFHEGSDLASQIWLDQIADQKDVLSGIGIKLIEVGRLATGRQFDMEIQERNARRMAKIASERSFELNARRIFIKAWVGLLDLQAVKGEQEFSGEELERRYSGAFSDLQQVDEEGDEA